MSTKFAIRPAPRKKPWVCKRSPPCLVAGPYPESVLMTYHVEKLLPPDAGTSASGTFTVKHTGPGLWYDGTDVQPAHTMAISFFFDAVLEIGSASAIWVIGIHGSMGAWPQLKGTAPPNIYWSQGLQVGPADPWTGFLLVTS